MKEELRAGETASVKGNPGATILEPSVPESLTKKVSKKASKNKKTVAAYESVGNISIKPFLDTAVSNMGLEDYDMIIFPGTFHEEQLAAIERNGILRYITGLDEYAPEVQRITDDTKREAVINNIRTVVSELEKQLASNMIKTDDPEFWNKVKLLKPDNHEFWSKITIRCGNEPMYLNPKKDPYDLIKFMAIEAGGFDLVGKSYEDARAQSQPPKFFLDKQVQTVNTRTVYKKLRNKAIVLLDDMFNKNSKKLFYVTKICDAHSAQYKVSTPTDILYDNMDEYILGQGTENNKNRAAETFIETAQMDMESLKLKALVKDASFYKSISLKADGMLYHTKTSTMMGRNIADVVEYLKNPLNEEILVALMGEIEKYWNA